MKKCSPGLHRVAVAFSAAILATALAAPARAQQKSFDWKQASGKKITIAFNQHPYADAIIQRLPQFKELTGIDVQYEITPEEQYFDKVTTNLSSASGNPDVFMTGIYQLWDYASAKRMEPLDKYLNDPAMTNPDYNSGDIFKGVFEGAKWDLKPSSAAGSGSLYALPLGFEMNVLVYNKKYFDAHGLKPPTTLSETVELAKKLKGWNGPGSYGIAVRGSRNWATIHPGYMSVFSNAGAKDFKVEGGKLMSALNDPLAISVTKQFAEMIKDGGPPGWSNYTWYQCGADTGAGKAAMMMDADSLAYFTATGDAPEAKNLAVAPLPAFKEGDKQGANEWVWEIAMNSSSKSKEAAWLFIQYFTGPEHVKWAAANAKLIDPPRQSAWEDATFKQKVAGVPGFVETFQKQIPNTSVKFTPQPYFIKSTTDWAATLQKIVLSGEDPNTAMKDLAKRIDRDTTKLKLD
ncbi:MAG TPA: sugar ABC transporter substrate-binding protein [Chthoniobacterales bacterium]